MSGWLDNDVHPLDPVAVEALMELLGDDRETLAELVDAFLEEAPARLADARSGVARGDLELSGRAAHTLKANALTFGAVDLAARSRELELAARGGDLAGARGLTAGLEAGWARARPALEALRDGTAR